MGGREVEAKGERDEVEAADVPSTAEPFIASS
jgi:hypothetical protein